MSWENPDFITLADVWTAYRKAKVDLYYERGHPYLLDISKYEENLEHNLNTLYRKLSKPTLSWMTDEAFIGEWSVLPKKIKEDDIDRSSAFCMMSDPDKAWNAKVKQGFSIKAQFRVVGKHSIDFAIVSSLWMLKVGHIYDAVLGPESYGTRLRRKHMDSPGRLAPPNDFSLGTFNPYVKHFAQWRRNGLNAMRKAIDDKKRIVAITADVRQFYHRVCSDFLLNPAYISIFELNEKLTIDDRRFTRALINAIHAWASMTPLHQEDASIGLPVGLPAARLIANVSLAEIDRTIKRELAPTYYGRYVDDIILVLEDTRDFKNEQEVWDWVIERCNGLLERGKGLKSKDHSTIVMRAAYLGSSKIEFSGDKQKVFFLEGETGLTLIDSIERHICEQASEWRMLPNVPSSPDGLSADLALAYDTDGDGADNLRKADSVSLRRAAFAIRLRDIEAFEHDLPPLQWREQRNAFYKSVIQHVLVLPRYFEDFDLYLPRLIGLAVACKDFSIATAMIERVVKSVNQIESDCEVGFVDDDGSNSRIIMAAWRRRLVLSISEVIAASSYSPLSTRSEKETFNEMLKSLRSLSQVAIFKNHVAVFKRGKRMFLQDLARLPYRYSLLPVRNHAGKKVPEDIPICVIRENCPLDVALLDGIASMRSTEDSSLPLPLLFPTRPFSVPELYLIAKNGFTREDGEKIRSWLLAMRGFKPKESVPEARSGELDISIEDVKNAGRKRIAVVSWKTNIDSWTASVRRELDPDATRYTRLNDLLNDILRSSNPPSYVILPELSVPSSWFYRIANKLACRGISLIAGIEYLHHGRRLLANQVWASLVSNFLGFPSFVIYRQDKKTPAIHEEAELTRLGHRRLRFLTNQNKLHIKHGDFYFSLLICSELTNIEFRQALRGQVDAVFVPEWNQDTEQFSSLVESAACDMHCYIVQCNDRQYGDSRIRSPAKDSWKRDVVRVKGGVEDYFVVGEIDYYALREFQSSYRSDIGPKAAFKPVPDGFTIKKRSRRRLPKSTLSQENDQT